MSKFNVGDRVRTKGDGFLGTVIDVHMSPGNVVAEMDGPNVGVEVSQFPGRKVYWLDEDSYEKVAGNAKIVITTDGITTIARLYDGKKVMKSAEAKCAPSDAFDFTIGANLAYDRLMDRLPATPPKPAEKPAQEPIKLYCVKDFMEGNFLTRGKVYEFVPGKGVVYDDEWCGGDTYGGSFSQYARYNPSLSACLIPLVQRPAKVGEWVLVTNASQWNENKYINGDVRQAKLRGFDYIRFDPKDVWTEMNDEEYLVLDGYQPEPEKREYWSGKLVCIDNAGLPHWTVNRVYVVTDGTIFDDDADSRNGIKGPNAIPSCILAKFVEYKGEAQ